MSYVLRLVKLSVYSATVPLRGSLRLACVLLGGELPDPPDPYVKLYLMPGKRKKKKTQVVKDSGNPRLGLYCTV